MGWFVPQTGIPWPLTITEYLNLKSLFQFCQILGLCWSACSGLKDFFYPQARGSKTSDIKARITPNLEDTKSENIGLSKKDFVFYLERYLILNKEAAY